MKALLIASVLLFSLRAMSAEVGEDQKSPCPFADQRKREAKVVEQPKEETKEKPAAEAKVINI
jgi:hypothetical protein